MYSMYCIGARKLHYSGFSFRFNPIVASVVQEARIQEFAAIVSKRHILSSRECTQNSEGQGYSFADLGAFDVC